MRQGDVVHFLHTDHLGSTSLTTDATGAPVAQSRYRPYGEQRWTDGDTSTDFTFTGQRADGFGLLDYNARYYDSGSGRFISPDTIVPNPANPQSLNRYAYTYNNPLKYRDSSGHFGETLWDIANIVIGVGSLCYNLSEGNYVDAAIDTGGLVVDVAATALPFVPGGAGAAIKAVRVANKVDNVVDAVNAADNVVDTVNAVDNVVDAANQIDNTADAVNQGDIILFNKKGQPDVPSTRPGKDGKVSCSACEPAEGIKNSFGREPIESDHFWKVNQSEVINNGGRFDFDGEMPVTDIQGNPLGGTYPPGHVSAVFPNAASKGEVERKMLDWLDGPYQVIK